MAPRNDLPPVRACLFDMDGLLIDTEDLYTLAINLMLEKYGRPTLPWSIKAQLQGRPGPDATRIFHQWAQLPISEEAFLAEYSELQRKLFGTCKPLPGVPKLLADLQAAGVDSALATSSNRTNFKIKTAHLGELFSVFPEHRRVLGDDTRLTPGRGKPLPDIFLLALKTINDSLPDGETPIEPEECLVFEDSVPGVEAGRRAGMRVAWCPHPGLKQEYSGSEREILAGRMGAAGDVDMDQVGELDDGWAECYETLEDFPLEHYGIKM